MNILVLNCGSSSIKYQLLNMYGSNKEVMAKGIVERVGLPEGVLIHNSEKHDEFRLVKTFADHSDGVTAILEALTDKQHGVINDIHQIDAVGHRVAHGGEFFSESMLVTTEVKEKIAQCSELAPLHNPANLKGITSMEQLLPNTPQVAAFDTSYHQTIPEKAYFYGLPYNFYHDYKIRRYGFHGTSHKFVAEKACKLTGLDIFNSKIVTCHMGNGVSVTAIKNGKSVDTSMGFTPLEGALMGTRCGDIDSGVVTYLQEKKNMSSSEVNSFLNKECGIYGISGISSDMRDLWKGGTERAKLAIDMFVYRIAKYIGAYAVAMNGLDAVVYTGGIGENDWRIRQGISEYLEFLGANLDKNINENLRTDKIISTQDSKVKLILAETNEELVIATDTMNIVKTK